MRFTLFLGLPAVTPDLIRGPVKKCPPAAGFFYWMPEARIAPAILLHFLRLMFMDAQMPR